jgi:hypothetical protein
MVVTELRIKRTVVMIQLGLVLVNCLLIYAVFNEAVIFFC